MPRWLRWIVFAFVGLLLILGIALYAAMQATQVVPDFYSEALQSTPEVSNIVLPPEVDAAENSKDEPTDDRSWHEVFTDDQINAWLANELPVQIPDVFPSEIEDPRILFEDGVAHVACKYHSDQLSAVLSVSVDAHLTDEPNTVAVRIRQARAGLLPFPTSRLLGQISWGLSQAGLKFHWTEEEGLPVAIVELPGDREDLRPGYLVQQLILQPGRLYVSGTVQ